MVDISAYISANTRIAFVEKANSNGERFYFDNVQIEVCTSTTAPIAYYAMDEAAWNGTSGEAVDNTGNGNHGTAIGTANTVNPGRVCLGGDIPFNNSNGAQDAIDSGVDIDADVGNTGTISFWYKSNANWVGGGNRMLLDASPDDLTSPDKYFYLVLLNNGRLRFALEDSVDGDYTFVTGVNGIGAGVWTHIAVTWNMSGNRQIFVNGALAASQSTTTNGQIGNLRTLYIGDNRSSYHPGATPNSANGVIDELRIYAGIQSASEIQNDMNATHVCTITTLDHFRITPATLTASTCLPNAVTIVAEDVANNPIMTFTDQVGITVSTNHGNWSVNDADNVTSPNPDSDDDGAVDYGFLASDLGVIVLDLSNTHAETLTVTVSGPGVSSTSANIVYSDNAFVITEDPIQVAGRPQAMSVALWTNDGASCFIDNNYNYNPVTIDAMIDRDGVLLGAIKPEIGGVGIPDGFTAPITLDFSVTPGQASFNLDTYDVGQYRLILTDNTLTHGDSAITGSGSVLTVRPFGIAVTNIVDTLSLTANPGNATPGAPIFTTAGNDLSATVSGVTWSAADDTNNDGVLDTGVYADNTAAPSYAWDTDLSVSLLAASYTPSPGTPGDLDNGDVDELDFSGGSAVVTDLRYAEVGSFTLLSAADDYLGEPSADIVGEDIVVGRFIPADFEVNIGNPGTFAEACGAFTYIGQDFGYVTAPSFTVTAMNALGDATAQYRDAFVKLNAGSVTVVVSQDDGTNGTDAQPLDVSYNATAMGFAPQNNGIVDYSFGADTLRYGPAAPVAFSKYANSRVGPFPADINPTITEISDGEVTRTPPSGTLDFDPTGNNLLFGRLRMENVHGSELNDLLMPVYTEFWNGFSFQKNLMDTCTGILDTDLDPVADPAGLSVPTVVNLLAMAGDIIYRFPSPGAANTGTVDTTTMLDDAITVPGRVPPLWLRYDWDADGEFDNDPAARATFGIFEGNPVQIYIQQVFE